MLLTHKGGSSVFQTLVVQTIIGLGGGLVNVPVQLGVQASASHQEVAAATAMFLTTLELGGAVGSAISGAVWTSSVPKRLRNYLPPESQKDVEEIFGKLTKALSYPPGSPTRIAINRAYEETMGTLLTIAVCVTIPLIPLSLMMKDYRLDKVSLSDDDNYPQLHGLCKGICAYQIVSDGPKGQRQGNRTYRRRG